MAEHKTPEESGRLRTQEAIFRSEFFWFGGLRDSVTIHRELNRPRITDIEPEDSDLRIVRPESPATYSHSVDLSEAGSFGGGDLSIDEGVGHVLYERDKEGLAPTIHEADGSMDME